MIHFRLPFQHSCLKRSTAQRGNGYLCGCGTIITQHHSSLPATSAIFQSFASSQEIHRAAYQFSCILPFPVSVPYCSDFPPPPGSIPVTSITFTSQGMEGFVYYATGSYVAYPAGDRAGSVVSVHQVKVTDCITSANITVLHYSAPIDI